VSAGQKSRYDTLLAGNDMSVTLSKIAQISIRICMRLSTTALVVRDGNGKETEKWISENIRDIRIRIRVNPIRFHPKGWKLEGNTNMVIRDI